MPKTNHNRRSELLVRCIPMLRGHARRLAEDRESARELLQEVILTILSSPSCPEDMPQFAAFCREFVQSIAASERAGGSVNDSELPWDEGLPEPSDPLIDPEQAMDTREELSLAIDEMGDEALKLLVRRYVLGENANELARDLAQTPAALRVRLMRLRSAARARHG